MTVSVRKIAEQVMALQKEDFDEFLSWLVEFELDQRADEWDLELERDSQPGGRLTPILERVRRDIKAGKTKPLDEIINNP